MEFLRGILGRRSVDEERMPLLDEYRDDGADGPAQEAFHDLQEGLETPHEPLLGRARPETGDRSQAVAQKRLSTYGAMDLAPEGSSRRMSEEDSPLPPGSPRSEDSARSTASSNSTRFTKEGGLKFIQSINPVIAMRAKNFILRLINWIGDLVAKMRGTMDERFKQQVMQFARQDVALCALLHLEGSNLRSPVKAMLQESQHPLAMRLKNLKDELARTDPATARYQELQTQQDEAKDSLEALMDVFREAIHTVAMEVQYTKKIKEVPQPDFDKMASISTVAEFERLLIQAHGCRAIDLEMLFKTRSGEPMDDACRKRAQMAQGEIRNYLAATALPMSEKIQFLKDYELFDASSAFFVFVQSAFESFEEDRRSIEALQASGMQVPLSWLRARVERATMLSATTKEGQVLSTERCSLVEINPLLTPKNLNQLHREDPFARRLFQVWAHINPTLGKWDEQQKAQASIADILANRSSLDSMDPGQIAQHTQLRYKMAVVLAQYMALCERTPPSKELAQLQLFISVFPYLSGTAQDPQPMFDAADSKLFEQFDGDFDQLLSSIEQPQRGQSLEDYVGVERAKLDHLNQAMKEAVKEFWGADGRGKQEMDRFKEPYLGAIREQARKVMLMHFVHFQANLPKK